MHREFYYWCRDAVRKIRYWKDRNKVYGELYAHLEERYESLVEKGYTPEEAEKKAVEAMGSAEELAPMLAAIHKPHWAYAALVTRVLAAALLIYCLSQGIAYGFVRGYEFIVDLTGPPHAAVWDPYTKGGEVCIASVEPNVSAFSDGYFFRVKKAALWRTHFSEPAEDGRTYFDQLYMQIKVTNPIPWMPEQQGLRWIWAVDSNGTYYKSFAEINDENVPWIHYRVFKTDWLTYTYDLEFQDATNDISWIELHYDRDGRDIVLRVDLTGGDENAG